MRVLYDLWDGIDVHGRRLGIVVAASVCWGIRCCGSH